MMSKEEENLNLASQSASSKKKHLSNQRSRTRTLTGDAGCSNSQHRCRCCLCNHWRNWISWAAMVFKVIISYLIYSNQFELLNLIFFLAIDINIITQSAELQILYSICLQKKYRQLLWNVFADIGIIQHRRYTYVCKFCNISILHINQFQHLPVDNARIGEQPDYIRPQLQSVVDVVVGVMSYL